LRRVWLGHLVEAGRRGHHEFVEDDTEATQLILEALFDLKVAVYEIREYLLGDDDGSEQQEEEEDS
jgi:hypothetical protein